MLKFYSTTTRMAKTKPKDPTKIGQESVRIWSSCKNIALLVGGSSKGYYHFEELFVSFLQS